MNDKVMMINLKGEVIVCTPDEAKDIQARQMLSILNNGFTSQVKEEQSCEQPSTASQ